MTQMQDDPSRATTPVGTAEPARPTTVAPPTHRPAHAGPAPPAPPHRMSTTAGLGSGEYVAINGTAVFALILGFASLLCLFEETILLVIPLVGIVAAIV